MKLLGMLRLAIVTFFVLCKLSYAQKLGTGPKFLMKEVKLSKGYDQSEINKIAASIANEPQGVGYICTDRTFWNSLKGKNQFQQVIKDADAIITKGFPQWSDEMYLSFYTKGDAVTGKDMMIKRLGGLMKLTWAACITDDKKYVSALEKNLLGVLNQKSWVYARSDAKKQNFTGKYYTIDLSSASYAHNLAQIVYLLGPKLSQDSKQKILIALDKRIFKPTKDLINGNYPYEKWMEMRNNWNAVCLSGVVGAALTVIENKQERAIYIDFARKYIHNYLSGFLKDGYCSEGTNYYNYGYRNFILLRENILRNSSGKIDLFQSLDVSTTNAFPYKIDILNGVYPTIGDTPDGIRPSAFIISYLNKKCGMPMLKSSMMGYGSRTDNLTSSILWLEKDIDILFNPPSQTVYKPEIRSEFEYAGILISRPKSFTQHTGIAALFKGGDNAENHNHNDLGEYNIVVGSDILVEDPGQITYTADIFGKQRYTYKSISSYGHSVPVVAGQQQISGQQAEAKVIQKSFSDAVDIIAYDLASAYKVPSLQKLHRTCKYFRSDQSRVIIKDDFAFKSPQAFETAVITRGKVQMSQNGSVFISVKNSKLLLTIRTNDGSKVKVSTEEINEKGSKTYTRIAIGLNDKKQSGSIELEYKSI